jgi:ABC-type lipoprotein release transport system permease subunit
MAAAVVAQAQAMAAVWAAAQVLWSGALLSTRGIGQPAAARHRGSLANLQSNPQCGGRGAFSAASDRGGLLLGRRLAESLGVHVGDSVRLTLVDANGVPVEALFVVRGLFASGVLVYDEATAFLPLAKAQSLTTVGNRAGAMYDAPAPSPGRCGFGVGGIGWASAADAHLAGTQHVAVDGGCHALPLRRDRDVDCAVIIPDTLLMAVFERTRGYAFWPSGMKRGQILCMLLLEATLLALIGSALGVLLGLARGYGADPKRFCDGEMAAQRNLPLRDVVYARFVPDTFAWLTVWTLIICCRCLSLSSWFAARLEPVKALHAR